jgi:hypothetical protein
MTQVEINIEKFLERVKMGTRSPSSKLMWVLDQNLMGGFRFISSPYGMPTFKEAKEFYIDSAVSEKRDHLRQMNYYMRQIEEYTRSVEAAKQVAIPGEQQ